MTALNKQALRYGDNVLWLLNELAAYDASDIDGGEFDVYGEDRNGLEGCSTIDITELAADAAKVIEAAEKRIAELQSDAIAPGIMRCAGCGFVLTKNNINMASGTITAGDSKTEPCPNGCGPLWLVTWKEQALQMRDDSESWFLELQDAKKRIAELQISRDKCFLSGLKTGWEYGIADDTEGYNREIDDAQAVIDRAAGIGVKGE